MGEIVVGNLRCEYEREPLGVQAERPLLSWQAASGGRNRFQTAYRIVAASSKENIDGEIYDKWDSGKVCSAVSYGIPYGGSALKSGERVFWRVQIWDEEGVISDPSCVSWFEMGLLEKKDWKGNWLSFLGGLIGNGILMRYSFDLKDKKVKRARAYVACAGYYEFRMNGEKVSFQLLNPAPTDTAKTILYTAYDVTDYLRPGRNVTGFILGTGWAGLPKVLLQMNIDYEDGSRQEIITDWGIGWCVAKGPITYNSIYDGEDYDARLEKEGWDTPEYEETFLHEHQRPGGWILATVAEEPGGKLTGQILPSVRIQREIIPEKIKTFEDGTELYDTGCNLTGWARIRIRGKAGEGIKLSFAEVLDEEGKLDKRALRLARCEDSYILAGKESEEYAPRFTYHGFRYFTLKKTSGVKVDKITVEHFRTDVRENVQFQCSDDFLNLMAQVMKHTDGCNLMGIPTDCCQRDERHGWTTDTTSRAEGSTYHFDMGSFFEKWMQDILDTQNEAGYFADTAPFRWGRRPCDPQVNTPVSLPLLLYHVYGNKRILEKSYGALKKYLEQLLRETRELVISRTGFGEWACPREECYPEADGAGAASKNVSPSLVSTGYLYYSLGQMEEIAGILGKPEKELYSSLKSAIKEKFNQTFYDQESHAYDQGTQSANALSIALGLAEEKEIPLIVENIGKKIEEHGNHMTTGNMGTKALVEVLSQNGREDWVYALFAEKTSPGFGYMLEQGATTIWERWEADKDNNIMNSRNHPMLSAACVWFYKYLGGINREIDGSGLQVLKIHPVIPYAVQHCQVEMDCLNGRVKTSWKKGAKENYLEVTVPFNTKAKVIFPKKLGRLFEGFCEGEAMKTDEAKETKDGWELMLGSGSYRFVGK